MRRVTRLDLPADVVLYLKKRQQRVNDEQTAGTLDVDKTWNNAGKTLKIKTARATLKQMAGGRQRCMYCSDSAGTDIEHFWPKSVYPERMFQWLNMLLCCTGCGRDCKGIKFPLDNGNPALLDPTIDDPWQFLDFSTTTGILFPLVDVRGGTTTKGEKTVELLKLDKRDEVNLGYHKSFRRIRRAIDAAVVEHAPDASALIHALSDADDHGLLGWCFRGNGLNESPLSDLRQKHPGVWAACEQEFRNH